MEPEKEKDVLQMAVDGSDLNFEEELANLNDGDFITSMREEDFNDLLEMMATSTQSTKAAAATATVESEIEEGEIVTKEKEKDKTRQPLKKKLKTMDEREKIEKEKIEKIINQQKKEQDKRQDNKHTPKYEHKKKGPKPPPPPQNYGYHSRRNNNPPRTIRDNRYPMEEVPPEYHMNSDDMKIYVSCCRDFNDNAYRLENVVLHIVSGRCGNFKELGKYVRSRIRENIDNHTERLQDEVLKMQKETKEMKKKHENVLSNTQEIYKKELHQMKKEFETKIKDTVSESGLQIVTKEDEIKKLKIKLDKKDQQINELKTVNTKIKEILK